MMQAGIQKGRKFSRFDNSSVQNLRTDIVAAVTALLENGGATQPQTSVGMMTYTNDGGQVEFKMSLHLKPPGEDRDTAKIAFDRNARRWNNHHHHNPLLKIEDAWFGKEITYDFKRYSVAEVNTACSKRPVLCRQLRGGPGLKLPPCLLRKLIY